MKLIKARAWIREKFEDGSRPTVGQVAAWIKNNEIPGEILGGEPYVYADLFDTQKHKQARQEKLSGFSLLA